MSRDEARDLVESVEDLTTLISDASPEDKAALYKELGIELTYQPDGRLLVEARRAQMQVRTG
jgi:site-specific DNA recombinase